MKNLHKQFLAAFLLATTIWGCTKKGDGTAVTTEIVHEFSCDQSAAVGETVYFKPVYPKGKYYLWDFGDGTTSKSEAPVHIYRDQGIFTVKLVVDDNEDLPIFATTAIYRGPLYTDLIARSWRWHHFTTFTDANDSITNISKPDTAFSIGYLTSSKLKMGADTLWFENFGAGRAYFFGRYSALRPSQYWTVAFDTLNRSCFLNFYHFNQDTTTLADYYYSY